MKTILRWAGVIALSLLPAASFAQSVGSTVIFPTGWAPGTSICVQQTDGKCAPVSAANPLPVIGGGGGGGGSGDASAANQSTQITAANLTNTRIGDITTPVTGSLLSRVDQVRAAVVALGTPLQSGGLIGNTAFAINGSLPAGTNALGDVRSTPVAYGSTAASVTIAAANTYQSILAANPNRRGCVITSKSSAAFTVFTGAPGSATPALSFDVLPGQSFSCAAGGIVISDQLSAASATASSTLLVVTQ